VSKTEQIWAHHSFTLLLDFAERISCLSRASGSRNELLTFPPSIGLLVMQGFINSNR
jgi:hypothetical protein